MQGILGPWVLPCLETSEREFFVRSAPELVDDAGGSYADREEAWTIEVEGSAFKFPVLAKFGIAMGVLTLAIISMIALLPMALPASVTISKAEQLISEIVGIDVTIKGKHTFRILPTLRLQAENIVQTNQNGNYTLNLPYLEIEMSALGALSGSVDLNRVMLRKPSLHIARTSTKPGTAEKVPEIDRAWGWWRDMSIEELQVENGDFTLEDSLTGKVHKLEHFSIKNVNAGKGEPDDGLMLDGQGELNGKDIKLHVSASNPQLLVSGNRWPFSIAFNSELLTGAFKGSMAMRERVVSEGELTLSGSDVVALNAWIGPFLPARVSAPMSLKAMLDMAGDDLNISRVKLSFGATALEGTLRVTGIKSGVAQISGSLDADTIDLGLAQAEQAVTLASMPLSLPGMPSGSIEVSWKNALWRQYQFGRGSATIERPPSTQRIQITLAESEIYGGIMRGSFALDVSEGMRAMSIEGRTVGAQIGMLLGAGEVQLKPALSGRSTSEISLFSVGGTPQELMQALTGRIEIIVQDGDLSIAELVKGLVPEAGTVLPFKTLNGTFNIAQGVADFEDLILLDGKLSLVGQGRIDLANWTIDLDVGRLGSEGDAQMFKKYHVSGPASDMKVKPINGS